MASSTTGAMNAPRSGSASTGSTDMGSPYTISVGAPKHGHSGAHLVALLQADQRAHGHRLVARIADDHLAEPRAHPGDHIVDHRLMNHRPTDAGASLPCLGGDLARDLLDVEVEFLRSRHGVRTEDRSR